MKLNLEFVSSQSVGRLTESLQKYNVQAKVTVEQVPEGCLVSVTGVRELTTFLFLLRYFRKLGLDKGTYTTELGYLLWHVLLVGESLENLEQNRSVLVPKLKGHFQQYGDKALNLWVSDLAVFLKDNPTLKVSVE